MTLNTTENSSGGWFIAQGGVYRCCLETIRGQGRAGTHDGEHTPCQHHDDGGMTWREYKRTWESPHAQRWEEEHRARLERNPGAYTHAGG